eukprot:3543392-Amphidinium_carterae.2
MMTSRYWLDLEHDTTEGEQKHPQFKTGNSLDYFQDARGSRDTAYVKDDPKTDQVSVERLKAFLDVAAERQGLRPMGRGSRSTSAPRQIWRIQCVWYRTYLASRSWTPDQSLSSVATRRERLVTPRPLSEA